MELNIISIWFAGRWLSHFPVKEFEVFKIFTTMKERDEWLMEKRGSLEWDWISLLDVFEPNPLKIKLKRKK